MSENSPEDRPEPSEAPETDRSEVAPERFTVRSTPPNVGKSQRRSYWAGVFAEGRESSGVWVRTAKWFVKDTAAQVASDVRHAHHRAPERMRVRGIETGDRWETRWGNDPMDPDPEHFYVWLRFHGCTPDK
jgi:hypothetical protein